MSTHTFPVDPACCCGVEPEPSGLGCRLRGGTATLCGIAAYEYYLSPNVPVDFYLRKEISGEYASCYDCASCPGSVPGGVTIDQWSGVLEYPGDTILYPGFSGCYPSEYSLLRRSGQLSQVNGCPTPDLEDNSYYEPGDCGDSPNTGVTVVCTPTTKTSTIDRSGITSCQGGPNDCAPYYERLDFRSELSNLDSNNNAIIRFRLGTSFGPWGNIDGGCSNPNCCLARWQVRTYDLYDSFAFQDAEWRYSENNLAASSSYDIALDVYRRDFENGAYALYASLVTTTATDAAGNLYASGNVPNDEGYETYVSNPVVTPA